MPERENPEGLQLKMDSRTKRCKLAILDGLTTPADAGMYMLDAIDQASRNFQGGQLVQGRFVLPISQEQQLLNMSMDLNQTYEDNDYLRVNGRIPFVDPTSGQILGLYYLTHESPFRAKYHFSEPLGGRPMNINHRQAVMRAHVEGIKPASGRDLPEIEILALRADKTGEMIDYLNHGNTGISLSDLAWQLARLHRTCFEYAHDDNQATEAGQREILENNPVVVALHHDQLVAVGLIEGDDSFNFGVHLSEPTYYTHPDFQRQGISTSLRIAVDQLIDNPRYLVEHGSTIVFSESIRAISFLASLRSGNAIAAIIDPRYPNRQVLGPIDGNLGNAYTYIGPANPHTGLMPMGLSFNMSNNITPYFEDIPNQFLINGHWIK